ncbi:unnamed protein product [Cyprideis torosa]|uniref:Uncharacterized protein n=1 Tax=Cyprideis torosa TaxID=163714 RepID=A0A7R8W2M6_9CRUS|nr:unnamed protein product [Cyprideis torosa]CAG0882109.1 unnamed protein product [Cyprideis torosa]
MQGKLKASDITRLCRISSSYHCSFPSSRYFGSDLKTDPSDKAQEPSKENARKSTPLPPDASFRQRTAHLWIRFKEMYRDYWYILVPVHAVTTAMWLGGFYVLAKWYYHYISLLPSLRIVPTIMTFLSSGLPLVPLLEAIGTPEWLMEPIRRSNAGYFAVAYALYKVITPARYATTLVIDEEEGGIDPLQAACLPSPPSFHLQKAVTENGCDIHLCTVTHA